MRLHAAKREAAASHYGRFDALAPVAGNSLDVEDRERQTFNRSDRGTTATLAKRIGVNQVIDLTL